ncbi:MAG: alpha-2-macroglobulin family protein [Bacteroidota bacterium]
MKYNKVIAIMSLTVLAMFFSSFDSFDYDKAWKKVESFMEKGRPKSALEEVKKIYDEAIKDNNISQQIKAVTYKTQLILQTEELGLETVIAEIEESMDKANQPAKQILHSLAGELMQQYFQSQYYVISQRTNLQNFDTGDIRTWSPNNFRSYIARQYLTSVDERLMEYKTSDFKDIVSNITNADLSLRPTLYELILDRALQYFSNSNLQGTKPSFSFKVNDDAYFSSVEDFVQYTITTKDTLSNVYQAMLLFQDGLRLQLKNGNRKVLAEYDLLRLNFAKQHAVLANSDERYIAAMTNAAQYYKNGLGHPFQIKIALDLRSKKKYEEAIDLFMIVLNDSPSDYTKSVVESWIATIKAKSLTVQSEQVIPIDENFLVNVSSRNLNTVCFKLLNAEGKDFSQLFSGKRELQKKKIQALPVFRRWEHKDIQKGYGHSTFEEIVDGLPQGKYILVASDTEEFDSNKSAFVFTAFFVSNIAHASYDVIGGKKVSVRDRNTGKPIKNATVDAYIREYNRSARAYEVSLIASKRTNKEGFAHFDFNQNTSVSYKIRNKNDFLDIEQFDYSSRLRKRDYLTKRVEIFTDRAIYRPGQTVHFKTLSMKIDKEGVPGIDPNNKLTITLRDANGEDVESMELKGNDFASASGSFILPIGRLTGQFSIHVLEGDHSTSQFFSVEEYKRPKFEVTLNDIEEEIKLGDDITVIGNAKALSGAPVSNGKVSYTITRVTYHGWWSWYRRVPNQSVQIAQAEINADEKGDFSFDFSAIADANMDPAKNPTYSYSIQVDVTDQAGETRTANKTISVGVFPYSYAWNLNEVMDIKDLDSINISPTTLENKKVAARATLVISELEQPKQWMKPRIWNVPSNPQYDKREFEDKIKRIAPTPSAMSDYPIKKELIRADVEFSEEGLDYDFSKIVKAGRAYKIELISEEQYRNLSIIDTKYIAVSDSKTHTYPNLDLLYIEGENELAEVGKPHVIELGTSDKELTVFYQIVRDWEVIEDGMLKLSNHQQIRYTPKERDRGGYTVIVDYVKHNFSKRERYNIALPWDNKDLDVALITERDKVVPGSREEWKLKISGKEKDKIAAELLATMYDASLDQFVNHSYSFGPYLNHFGNIQGRFYGFNNALMGNLNSQWSRSNYRSMSAPVVPVLKGLNLGFRPSGGLFRGNAVGDVRIRGRSQTAIELSAPEAANYDDNEIIDTRFSESVGYGVQAKKANGTEEDVSPPQNKVKEISIRKNLDESVFFYPHLKTDEDGNVILSFTMNEALTSWKLLTFAHDKELRFGMSSHEVKTQKDVMIVPNAPRFLREGDRLVFPATVTNLSESEITASAELELIDPANDSSLNDQFGLTSNRTSITVPMGESKRVDWDIVIPKDYKGLVKYRVSAKAGVHTDGEENLLPVVTNQTLVTETKVISLKKKEKKTFTFDALSRTASNTSAPFKYTLEYTSNPVWYAVQALPYLMEYPHNCTEQIFNRLYANTMASYIANQNPRIKAIFDQWKAYDSDALISNLEKNESLKSALLEETPWVRQAKSETEQKKRIALLFDLNKMSSELVSAMDELQKRQMQSGAFPWFTGGREDVFITQTVVEGIAHLQHLGIISSADYKYVQMLERALVYLDEQSKKRYDKILENINRFGGKKEDDHLDYLSIHYLYIRSFFPDRQIGTNAREAYDYFIGQAEKYWLNKGLYSEAMIGLTLKRANNPEYTNIVTSLEERSFYSDELGRYWNIGSGFNWHELPIESHAMLIEFFTEAKEDSGFVEDMKIWLLKNKQTNHWKTTKGTAAAIYALLIQGEEEGMISWINEDNPPVVQLNGKDLEMDQSKTELGTGYFQKVWTKEEITGDLSEITIDNRNETIAWGAAYYQYFEDLDKVKDFRDTPLKMKRTLFKEVKTDRDPELTEINEQTQLEPGDRVIVRIEIKVDRSMSYVHLKDMRGSGFEPENVLSGYRWKSGLGYYESTRDLASHFFISRLNKGTYVFEYPLRVVHKGEFSSGIATLQCMYAPEFTSHSEGGRVLVN